MTPEGRVKELVMAVLMEFGVYYFMPRGTAFGRAGVPDFVCCHKGKFIAIETKAGKNRCTPLQIREQEEILAHVGASLIINETNMPELRRVLETM